MEGFEEYWEDNFKDVDDPVAKMIARESWNGCWEKVISDYKRNKEDENYNTWEWRK